jgi:hypothetical protein
MKVMTRKSVNIIGALIAASALTLGVGSAQAASACKGLDQGACGKKSDCTWVGGYTRKDGAKVSGYCRTKSSGGSKKSSTETKKKAM